MSQNAIQANELFTNDDNLVLKTMIINRGKSNKASPNANDSVDILFKILHVNGSLVNSDKFSGDSSTLNFKLNATPPQAPLGWENAVKTMCEGERSVFKIPPLLAFARFGDVTQWESAGIPINTTLLFEIELLKIYPSLKRKYKSVQVNESIKEELVSDIYSGKSLINEEMLKSKPFLVEDEELSSTTISGSFIPTAPLKINPEKEKTTSARFYDEEKDKLDPKRMIKGQAEDNSFGWEETISNIDLIIPLPNNVANKDQISVEIGSKSIRVILTNTDQVLLEGPLHGKILPSDSSWALEENGDYFEHASKNRMSKVILSLEKAHGWKDLWATVFDRSYLKNRNIS
eukprot:gene13268-17776_t